MPLDPRVRDVLEGAKALLGHGWFRHGPNAIYTSHRPYCLSTALHNAANREPELYCDALEVVAPAIGAESKYCTDEVAQWNDSRESVDEVIGLLDSILLGDEAESYLAAPPTRAEQSLADACVEAMLTGLTVDAILAEGARAHLLGPPIRPAGQAETIFGRAVEGSEQYAADEDPNWRDAA